MNFIAGVVNTNGGPIHLVAHSMGNVVAAEALRLWNSPGVSLVDTYVAMQGAISAGAYGDDSTDAMPWVHSGVDYYRHFSADAASGSFYMDGTKSAADRWVNMYNADDAATSGAWPLNNAIKEFASFVRSADNWPYAYTYPQAFVQQPLRHEIIINGPTFFNLYWPVGLGGGIVMPNGSPGPTAYEVLAHVSMANAKPIGTKPLAGWFDANLNLKDPLYISQGTADKQHQHSFQFNNDAATVFKFYETLSDETWNRP